MQLTFSELALLTEFQTSPISAELLHDGCTLRSWMVEAKKERAEDIHGEGTQRRESEQFI